MAEVCVAVWLREIRVRLYVWHAASRDPRLFNRMNFLWQFLVWPLPYAVSYCWSRVLASLTLPSHRGCRWYGRNYGFIDTISLITAIVQQTVLFNIRMNSINQSRSCQRLRDVSLQFYIFLLRDCECAPAFGTRSLSLDIEKVFDFFFCPSRRRE